MKKILLSLSILSLGIAQVPLYGGTGPLFAFKPAQHGMSTLAKITLFVGMLVAGYGCYTLFNAWVGTQQKRAPHDKKAEKAKDAPVPRSASTQIAQNRAEDEKQREEQRVLRVQYFERERELKDDHAYAVQVAEHDQQQHRQIADDAALARRVATDEHRQDGDVKHRAACSAAPAPSAPVIIEEHTVSVTQQAGDERIF